MTLKNKKIKFISILLIISILAPSVLFSAPKKAQAFWGATWLTDIFTGSTAGTTGVSAGAEVTQTALALKDVAKEILRQVIMTTMKRLLASMTKSITNWINTGFHGAPLFLENPKSFFRDIAKYEIKLLVDLFGYDPRRFPFGKQFALNTISSYKRQLADNAEYTLSSVIQDPDLLARYRNDFDFGGWNGFLINTQYPQNNYLGFQMIATEELARKLQGTATNNIQRVQDTLQQGMGFLSPKTCPSNPKYNNMKNEFQQPRFNEAEYNKAHPFNLPDPIFEICDESGCETTTNEFANHSGETEESKRARKDYADFWDAQREAEKARWIADNTCPGELVATTPGSVVGNQIMTALSSNYRQSELGAALGNSISAIFDTLINKFLGDGLNALASKVNPPPPTDDWSYDGQSLGSPADSVSDAWDVGPDEEIILDDFKKQLEGKTIVTLTEAEATQIASGVEATGGDTTGITTTVEEIGNTQNFIYDYVLKRWPSSARYTYIPGDIANTDIEIKLLNDLSSKLGDIWPQARRLDICQPGPDIGWEDRTMEELSRNSKKLQERASNQDGEKAAAADLVLKELKFAVNFFKDWINNEMLTDLPSSVLYIDAVDEIGELAQQSDELTDNKRTKTQALARLNAIKTALAAFTTQPEPGSSQEKALISLRKQYNATRVAVSNPTTIDSVLNELAIATEQLANLNNLVNQCNAERTKRGWSVPGGPTSRIGGVTEKEIFCDNPIKGGYDHESFRHSNDGPEGPGRVTPGHELIPYVNAKDVLKWRGTFGLFGHSASIKMSCNIIWKANVLDYKGNLPGTTQVVEPYVPLPDDTSSTNLGTCNIYDPNTGETITEPSVTQDECAINFGTWIPDEQEPVQ